MINQNFHHIKSSNLQKQITGKALGQAGDCYSIETAQGQSWVLSRSPACLKAVPDLSKELSQCCHGAVTVCVTGTKKLLYTYLEKNSFCPYRNNPFLLPGINLQKKSLFELLSRVLQVFSKKKTCFFHTIFVPVPNLEN